jgi:putative GTP pyrophosphokinase
MTRATSPPSRTRALYERNLHSYRGALRVVQEQVEALLAQEGIRATVTSRVKSFESYLEKVARLRRSGGRPVVVRDLLGLRVVCAFLDETERVRDLLVDRFPVVEIEQKGPLHSLAEFGYESLHVLTRLSPEPAITLPPRTRSLCEVQVRTILQDAWAQIEHELVYKSDDSLPRSAVRRKLAAVSATLTLADVIFQEVRDAQSELRQRGAQRRESALQAAFARDPAPLATAPLEMSRLARPDPALRDPRSRDIESRIVEALWLHSAGQLEPAIGAYGRILRLRLPSAAIRSMIYNHRGIARLALSQPKRALRDFDRALRVDRENFRAHYNRGLCYRALDQPERALRELRRAAGAHAIEASARYAMAQVLADLGRRRQARAECERALALNPKLEGARELVGLLARQTGSEASSALPRHRRRWAR